MERQRSNLSGSQLVLSYGKSRLVRGNLLPKICQFDIKLDNDDSTQPGLFLSGTFISGHIILNVAKPTSIVRIRFICEGLVRIGDTKQTVISYSQVLFGPEKGRKPPNKFAGGRYTYPFSVDLAADLPTTIFRSNELKVSYKCSAMLVRKQQSDDILIERPVIVHSINQVIYDQLAQGQAVSESNLSFQNLSAVITLPKSGFYLGEEFTVRGVVSNPTSSSRKVKVGVCIIRTLKAHGSKDIGFIKLNRTKKYITVVTDKWSNFFKVPKQGTEEFEVGVPLNLTEPTTKHELIDIEYIARVSFIAQGLLSDSKPKFATFPITVAPPKSLAQYPANYSTDAPTFSSPPIELSENDLSSSPSSSAGNMLYPTLYSMGASAPAEDFSDEDNLNVHLPSYEDVISGKY